MRQSKGSSKHLPIQFAVNILSKKNFEFEKDKSFEFNGKNT
jgi:hypothetical protein